MASILRGISMHGHNMPFSTSSLTSTSSILICIIWSYVAKPIIRNSKAFSSAGLNRWFGDEKHKMYSFFWRHISVDFVKNPC